MVNFLLGEQAACTKYPCFLYYWDSRLRGKHWVQKYWRIREHLLIGEQNIVNKALVSRDKIIFPTLYIKLGLIKEFVKALDKEGQCFRYLRSLFAGLSKEKLKAGIFDSPQIRKMINDEDFIDSMLEEKKDAWTAFVDVVPNFLGNRKAENYEETARRLLRSYQQLGCNTSIKIHFLFSHLEQFADNFRDYSDEQGERFHQDLKVMEGRYKGRWDINMLADYCWSIKRDEPLKKYRRVSKKKIYAIVG